MSAENKAIVQRFFDEAWNKGNLGIADELLTQNVVSIDPMSPDAKGIEACKEFIAVTRAAFSDVRVDFDELLAEGDTVLLRWTFHGTRHGEFFGITLTGKRVTVKGVDIVRLSGGKIEEFWGSYDTLGWMQQLGVVTRIG